VTVEGFNSLLLRPQFPFDRKGHIYGLIGISSMNLGRTSLGARKTTKSSSISYGVGFKLHFMDTWAVGAEYTRYTGKQDFNLNKARVTGFAGTVNYMFD